MTTNWVIANMKRIEATGVVVDVTYIFNAEEEGILDRYVGSMTFSGNPSDPGFIPYEDLTQDDVLTWVFNDLGDRKAVIEADVTGRVQTKVDQKNNNPYGQGVPWNS